MPESELPPPSVELSALKLMVLVWFLSLPPPRRARVLKIMVLVTAIFEGPVKHWPMDFGRPLSEAEDVIVSHRKAAAWIKRQAEVLELVKGLLPE